MHTHTNMHIVSYKLIRICIYLLYFIIIYTLNYTHILINLFYTQDFLKIQSDVERCLVSMRKSKKCSDWCLLCPLAPCILFFRKLPISVADVSMNVWHLDVALLPLFCPVHPKPSLGTILLPSQRGTKILQDDDSNFDLSVHNIFFQSSIVQWQCFMVQASLFVLF